MDAKTRLNSTTWLDEVVRRQQAGEPVGITAICTSNPFVLEAALLLARKRGVNVLIEATCNQVNQYGGYSGMKPLDFMHFMQQLVKRCEFPQEAWILGGDHLGPSVWRHEPSASAMAKAQRLVQDYVLAGARKIHLDASMPLGDDPDSTISTELAAQRSADLALAAEHACQFIENPHRPRYVIGTEVPMPGGATSPSASLEVSLPESVQETIEFTRKAFISKGLEDAWQRVIAIVAQPGVEFSRDEIHDYQPQLARPLAKFIEGKGMVYEAHSTDYQTAKALRQLVQDHFAILKVGPALTFALREGLFALALMEKELLPSNEQSRFFQKIDETMLSHPEHWLNYYFGTEDELRLLRYYSFSDRIRYYWSHEQVKSATHQLIENLKRIPIPLSLLSQFMPRQYERIREGELTLEPVALLIDKVQDTLWRYFDATQPAAS